MTAASKAYPWQLVLIKGWPIDCTRTETHTFDSEITEFPVESGSVISDNVRLLPLRIDLECIVSNTPFGEAARQATPTNVNGERGIEVPEAALRSNIVYEHLRAIQNAREPVTIRTSRGKFESMLLKTLTIPRDNQTGDAIVFTANFQQVLIINNTRGKRVAIPIAKGGPKKKVVTMPVQEKPIGQCYKGPFARVTSPNAWYDPDIGAWRKYWTYTKDPSTAEGRQEHHIKYHKGPLIDGSYSSGDASLKAFIKDEYKFMGKEQADLRFVPSSVRLHQEQAGRAAVRSQQNPAGLDFQVADPTIVTPPTQSLIGPTGRKHFDTNLLDE